MSTEERALLAAETDGAAGTAEQPTPAVSNRTPEEYIGRVERTHLDDVVEVLRQWLEEGSDADR